MPNVVQDFYMNQVMREAVKQYFLQSIEAQAVEKVFNREDVSHIADALELVQEIFKQMDADFRPKAATNNLNNAR